MSKLIRQLDFLDTKINVYYYPDSSGETISWQIRNPDSAYQGVMFRNVETGRMSYPDGAIVPVQSLRDKEMLPKFIIIGNEVMSDELAESLLEYIKVEYKKRNSNCI
jgi:hypothetical protein